MAVANLPTPSAALIARVSASMPHTITHRDVSVNTFRVRRQTQAVNTAPMAFSDQLKAARIAAGMTQEQLALACGWSGQSRIANYESSSPNSREPKVSEIPLLAKALGVSVAHLFGESSAKSHVAGLNADRLAESIAALRQVAKNKGWTYDPETHPTETIAAYELNCAMPSARRTADVIDFGDKVAELLRRRQGDGDGQGKGESVGGTDRKRIVGRGKKH